MSPFPLSFRNLTSPVSNLCVSVALNRQQRQRQQPLLLLSSHCQWLLSSSHYLSLSIDTNDNGNNLSSSSPLTLNGSSLLPLTVDSTHNSGQSTEVTVQGSLTVPQYDSVVILYHEIECNNRDDAGDMA
ncbi:hypothetical protein CFOL_v3_24205 [Cephalotus follicularis]|uniref:Uncharacterized protein n=1 Tax=Cephalotus follicularis TaxID=3775 RepID=A0A1Q3CKM8_CEPFO|nr:hypothetical protein CFOL_v3_24205 [Cephalotus follicularis]